LAFLTIAQLTHTAHIAITHLLAIISLIAQLCFQPTRCSLRDDIGSESFCEWNKKKFRTLRDATCKITIINSWLLHKRLIFLLVHEILFLCACYLLFFSLAVNIFWNVALTKNEIQFISLEIASPCASLSISVCLTPKWHKDE
jgi:hypothetical protein